MPRVAKDKEKTEKKSNIIEKKEAPKTNAKSKSSASIKATSKKETKTTSTKTKKAVTQKKEAAKKSSEKKEKVTKKTTSTKKSATTKKVSTTKKVAAKKSAATKKATTKKAATTKKTTTRKTVTERKENIVEVLEYYDLPFRYNQTVVKVLAQTPTNLFIYWDISDDDRNRLLNQYGDNFFNYTKPVLIITNETKNYTFEIDINDFANSWYLHVEDSNCKYKIELGRRPKNNEIFIENNYVYIDSSNEIEAPNNHILFDELKHSVFFKDVKTNNIVEKDISSMSFITRIGKLYNIYDLYKEMYKDELIGNEFGLTTLSSSPSSSNFI